MQYKSLGDIAAAWPLYVNLALAFLCEKLRMSYLTLNGILTTDLNWAILTDCCFHDIEFFVFFFWQEIFSSFKSSKASVSEEKYIRNWVHLQTSQFSYLQKLAINTISTEDLRHQLNIPIVKWITSNQNIDRQCKWPLSNHAAPHTMGPNFYP